MFGRQQGWRWHRSLVRRILARYFENELRWLDPLAWGLYWRVYLPSLHWIERNIGD